MTPRRAPGHFITVEGGDGVGKTTQIARLRDRLTALGHRVVVTREPGGAPGAEEIRRLLVTGAPDRWSAKTEALLMNAARADHLERTILPALAAGKIVLCDRFADSTLAYQSLANKGDEDALSTDWVTKLQTLVVGAHMPVLTLVLHMGEAAALARVKDRETNTGGGETRFEDKGPAFQARVAAAFVDIANAAPDRCALVSAEGSPDDVATRLWQVVETRLPTLVRARVDRDGR
ncbi:MAG: dTMP kinase [Pseudomonadota bacterium]